MLAQCMFCDFKYSNQFLAPSKRQSHLQKNMTYLFLQLFKKQPNYLCKQQNSPYSSVLNEVQCKEWMSISADIIDGCMIT